jgi:hypothetical protein
MRNYKPFAVSARPILNGLLEKGYKIVQSKRYTPYILLTFDNSVCVFEQNQQISTGLTEFTGLANRIFHVIFSKKTEF